MSNVAGNNLFDHSLHNFDKFPPSLFWVLGSRPNVRQKLFETNFSKFCHLLDLDLLAGGGGGGGAAAEAAAASRDERSFVISSSACKWVFYSSAMIMYVYLYLFVVLFQFMMD